MESHGRTSSSWEEASWLREEHEKLLDKAVELPHIYALPVAGATVSFLSPSLFPTLSLSLFLIVQALDVGGCG
jgi:hypothetical protein